MLLLHRFFRTFLGLESVARRSTPAGLVVDQILQGMSGVQQVLSTGYCGTVVS